MYQGYLICFVLLNKMETIFFLYSMYFRDRVSENISPFKFFAQCFSRNIDMNIIFLSEKKVGKQQHKEINNTGKKRSKQTDTKDK